MKIARPMLIWATLVWGGILLTPVTSWSIEVTSHQAYLVDTTTNTVLYQKDADATVPTSSMSKIMTAYMVFEALSSKQITLEQTFLVSHKAWKMGGSRMFLNINDQVSISDLLRGLIVQSGNDAAVVLAEGLMGDEAAFAAQMTKKARELGATTATFKNATGWPEEGHEASMKDLATIAIHTIKTFPTFYPLYAEIDFTHNKIKQMNRNPLLYANMGADGLKTGSTDNAGFGLVGSAVQQSRRLILAINGAKSKQKRADDAKALMAWGFTYFTSPKIVEANKVVSKADVWLGQGKEVSLTVAEDVYVTVPRHQLKEVSAELIYDSPIAAPVKAGQVVGKIRIQAPEQPLIEKPLIAMHDVERAGFIARMKAAIQYMMWGHN